MVESAILVVSADVISGKDEEFNKWYNEHHIPEYSGKLPFLKSVRRYYSKRSEPQYIAIYEYETYDDLKKSVASQESKLAGDDADKQVGVLVKSFTFNTYSMTFSM